MSRGKHTLYAHDLQMLKNLLMQCPTFKAQSFKAQSGNSCVTLSATDYKALWELKVLVEEILEQVEE